MYDSSAALGRCEITTCLDDTMTWKHSPPYWPFVKKSTSDWWLLLTKGQLCGALIFSFLSIRQAKEQTVESMMIRGTTSLMWHHYNILYTDSCMFSFPVSEEITAAFRRFGPLVVDWPHKAESKSYFPPKGRTHFTYSQSPHNLTSLRGVARLKWCGWKITQIFTVKSLI